MDMDEFPELGELSELFVISHRRNRKVNILTSVRARVRLMRHARALRRSGRFS